MAVDMFLKITEIPGESRDEKHKGEIEVYSFSWAVSQFSDGSSGGGGSGKADFQDFSFAMPVSKASPKLFLACASGQHFPEATLSIRKAAAEPNDFLVYKLSDCLVSSFQEGGAAAASELPGDSFSLNFAKIDVSYKEQNDKGGLGTETRAGWDLKQNKSF